MRVPLTFVPRTLRSLIGGVFGIGIIEESRLAGVRGFPGANFLVGFLSHFRGRVACQHLCLGLLQISGEIADVRLMDFY